MAERNQRPGSSGGRWDNSYYSRYRPRQRQHSDLATANPNNQPIGNTGSQYRPGSNYSKYDSQTYSRPQQSSYRGGESYYARGYNKHEYDPSHARHGSEPYQSRFNGSYETYPYKNSGSHYSSRNSRPNYRNQYPQQSQPQQTYYGQRPKSYGGQSESGEDFYDGKPSSTGSVFLRNDYGSRRSSLINSTNGKLNAREEDDDDDDDDNDNDDNDDDNEEEEEEDLLPIKSLRASKAQQKPSLIPKDFKDDYNDEEDDEMEKKLRGETSTGQTPNVAIRHESELISNKIPLTTEHKEALDAESRESSEELQNRAMIPPESSSTSTGSDEVDKLHASEDVEPQTLTLEKKDDVVQEQKADSIDDEDDYDPTVGGETLLGHQEEKYVNEPAKKENEKETKHEPKPEDSKEEAKVEIEAQKIDVKVAPKLEAVVSPLHPVESFIFPQTELESRLWELKNQSREFVIRSLPYLLKRPVKGLCEYPFYERNFLVHEQLIRPKLINSLSIIKNTTYNHKMSLYAEYNLRSKGWEQRLENMNAQLSSFYPPKIEPTKEQEKEESEPDLGGRQSSRRRRHHGDSVRSEAEFLEILKNFEKEKEDDPLYRAEQSAAKIPDMILDPVEKHLKLLNTNNLVTDKKKWAERIKTDAVNNFTSKEHEAFCEAFLSTPKRFGRISIAMGGLRTPEECVLHYYKTKKTLTDYKQLLANKKKRKIKGQGKGKRGPKAKTSGSTSNTPTAQTPAESGDELGLENFIPKEVNEEVLYTETGRRRRAAAPSFEKTKRPSPEGVQTEDEDSKNDSQNGRKRSLDSAGTATSENAIHQAIVNQGMNTDGVAVESTTQPVKKKQRGPKPRKHVEETEVDPVTGEQKGKYVITSYWSVRDINLFGSLLSEFGKNWQQIADKLKTKSPIMVRNYYLKNADTHGWRDIAEGAEIRFADQPSATAQSPSQIGQQVPHRNPPLGFFTAPTNVPSNISFHQPLTKQAKSESQNSQTLPSVNNLTFPSSQALPLPTFPSALPAEQPVRSNPFSITSLLNPPEDRKPVPPLLPTTYSNAGDLYSGYREPSSVPSAQKPASLPTSSSTTIVESSHISAAPFNQLSALVAAAAADDNSTWKQLKAEEVTKSAYDPVRSFNESSNYNRTPYTESSERGHVFNPPNSGRSILNSPPKPSPSTLLPMGSSNLRNLLTSEPQEERKHQ